MLHPDLKYQMYLSLQQERLEQAKKAYTLSLSTSKRYSLRERLLLSSGEWLITLGTNLKQQAQPELCVSKTG